MSRTALRTVACMTLLLVQSSCRLPQPGTHTGTLLVTVIDGVTGEPVGGVSTRLGAGGSSRTDTTDTRGTVQFEHVVIGPLPLAITDPRACRAATQVNVVGDGLTKVTLRLCADVVEPANAAGEPLVAMLDITTQGPGGATACTNDFIVQGTGSAELGVNAVSPGSCPRGVAIYTARHAIAYSRDVAAMPWTSQLGDVYGVPLPADPLRVPVHVILADPALRTLMTTQLSAAQQVLDYSLAGIQLVGATTGGPVEITDATVAQAQVIGQDCTSVTAIRQDPALYDAGRLNVYAVQSINVNRQGLTCVSELAPDIIFIKPDISAHNTLAHEIGHSLALNRPAFGHTEPLDSFPRSSVMYSTGTIEPNAYLSIGQVTRMTFDNTSWVNLPSSPSGSSLRMRLAAPLPPPLTVPCGCPENVETDACPRLSRDIPRPLPFVPGNGEVRACGVDHLSVSMLVCNAPTLVTATLSPPGAPGAAIWHSSDPSRLTIGPSAVDLSAVLTGRRNGPALVHVNGSGSAASFTLPVTGCP